MEFIYEIENAIPKEMCEELIQRFLNDDRKEPAGASGTINPSIRKSTNLWIPPNIDWIEISEKLFKTIVKNLKNYGRHLVKCNLITSKTGTNLFEGNFGVEPLFINQSKEGEYYHWHIDDGLKSNIIRRRSFSCIIYLNTLEEDQGGCTEFMCGKKVRPERGKMLIFPSSWTYEHRGAEVKNGGVKYICGTWVS
jgi:hypothetical protein